MRSTPATQGLRDRGVEEVGADRRHRLHPEHENEQRGHDRAAADPGHPDQQAHAQAEEHDHRVDHGRSLSERVAG